MGDKRKSAIKLQKTSFDISPEKLRKFRLCLLENNLTMRGFLNEQIDHFIAKCDKEKRKED